MNVTALYYPTTSCRSGPASCGFVLCCNNGATTLARKLYSQVNERVIERRNKLLRLLSRQTDDSTSGANRLIPIACTLIKVHQ